MVLSAQDNESLRWRLIQMNVIVVWFYLLRLRDSGIWNDRLQQKLDDTELIFLIINGTCGTCRFYSLPDKNRWTLICFTRRGKCWKGKTS